MRRLLLAYQLEERLLQIQASSPGVSYRRDLNTDSLKIFFGHTPLEKRIRVETASINLLIFHQEVPLLGDKLQENENSEIGLKKRTRQDHPHLKGLGGGFWLAKDRGEP